MAARPTTVVPDQVDVVVVGGGPAGLSAALVLGRSRRSVVVFDSGEYRNARSGAAHGWLTRDGTSPAEILRLGRAELARYDVKFVAARVVGAQVEGRGFRLAYSTASATHHAGRISNIQARAVVLATGLRDIFPPIPGLQDLVGRGVCVCPYCDAWELRDQQLGVLGENGGGLALSLRTWSRDVILFTDGKPPPPAMLADLRSVNVTIVDMPVRRLLDSSATTLGGFDALEKPGQPRLRAVELLDGTRLPVAGLFVKLARQEQRSDLARQLGLAEVDGDLKLDRRGASSVPGVWVAGDASRDLLFVSIAVAEGATAATAVNHALQLEGWGLR